MYVKNVINSVRFVIYVNVSALVIINFEYMMTVLFIYTIVINVIIQTNYVVNVVSIMNFIVFTVRVNVVPKIVIVDITDMILFVF